MISTTLVTILSLALAPQDADAPKPQSQTPVFVKVGDLYGRILGVENGLVTVTFRGIEGSRSSIAAKLIPADKLYAFRATGIDTGDAAAWHALAEYAAQHDLPMRRIEALRTAAGLQPERKAEIEQQIATIRQTCGTHALEQARQMREDGDTDAAVEELEQIEKHYAECEAAKAAKTMLAELRASEKNARSVAEAKQTKGKAQPNPDFEAVKRLLERGQTSLKKGLQAAGKYVEAKDDFETALALFERARDRLARLSAEGAAEQMTGGTEREHKRLTRAVSRNLVRAHVEIGYVYVALGVAPSAYRHAGRAAALDPGNSRVANLRLAIAARTR